MSYRSIEADLEFVDLQIEVLQKAKAQTASFYDAELQKLERERQELNMRLHRLEEYEADIY